MIKKEWIVYFDLSLAFLSLFLFLFFSPDISILISSFILCFYLIFTKRYYLFYHLLLSFIISIIWMFFAKNEYRYNVEGLYFFDIRIFTLLAWTLGLFISYVIYSHYEYLVHKKNNFLKICFYALIYWPLLLIAETIGYHVFNIKNFVGVYPGLPICDCMHAASWMKLAYFSLGMVYISICFLIKLENPHKKR